MVLDTLIPDEPAQRSMWRAVVLVATLVLIAALWHWTPLASWLDPSTLRALFTPVRQSPWAPLIAVGVYIAGGLVGFPVTLLVFQTALVFGPWLGALYTYTGAALSASLTYGLGRLLGQDAARRIARRRLRVILEQLQGIGVLAFAALRIVPIAPFSVINVIAGAAHVRYRAFLLGTLLGLTPTVVGFGAFGASVASVITDPDAWSVTLAVVIGAGVVVGALLLRRALSAPPPNR